MNHIVTFTFLKWHEATAASLFLGMPYSQFHEVTFILISMVLRLHYCFW